MYGNVIWDENITIKNEEGFVMLIPTLLNQEVEGIWLFDCFKGTINYAVIVNDQEIRQDKNMDYNFAYFEQTLLNKNHKYKFVKPDQKDHNIRTKEGAHIIEHCNMIFTGNNTIGYELTDYHCWDEYVPGTVSGRYIYDNYTDQVGGGQGDLSDGGGGANSGSDPNPNPNPNPLPPIEVTQDFLNNEKLNCIWGKINNILVNQNNSLITSVFANFSGVSYNPQDITITLQDNLRNKDNEEIYGNCLLVKNNFLITLNGSYIENRAPIEIFKTIIHEMLHAHLKRMYNVSPDTFKSLFSMHIKNTKGVTLSEHDIMQQYYIPVMINALKSFDDLNGYSDDNYVYEGIIINGLDLNPNIDTQQHVVFSEEYFRSRNLNCEK
ncbi:hypothetical protein [Marinifilum fragile]|uniref:hypothetical protein n=1 Tax=Marinifilum fragile TaxID=570161 RepID=UPI002AA69A98|nr:hypothetical protein [Marinifilum fragile]